MRANNTSQQDALKRYPAFAALDDSSLQRLLAHASTHNYPAGKVFLREGQAPEWVYLLLAGMFSLLAWRFEGR